MTSVWMHKKTGDIVLVTELFISENQKVITPAITVYNTFYELWGYKVENCQGIIGVFDHVVKDHFEVIGEWD